MGQYIGSTTPLNAGVTFTSPWTLTDYNTAITGSVLTDQAGSIIIDQSGDGISTDLSTTTAVVASTGLGFNVTLLLPYYRVRMTNTAGSNQTSLRLFTRMIPGNRP